MRILSITTLSVVLIAVAPVFVGLGVIADPLPQMSVRETVIAKTAPDGTWPFKAKAAAQGEAASYWI